ncbi:MAG TPA: cation transporter, partial [Patescibacteria group bacterium]|nr:cation transporter [Patescibacteria group bacterium]
MKDTRVTSRRVVVTSFLIDIVDLISSLIVAWLSGSIVMLTQALEGLTDLVSSGFLVLGLKRSLRKEDRTHPFGYGREIYFWTLISALVMLGSTAVLSLYFGYQRFIHPHPLKDMEYAFLILFLSIFTNGYGFSLSYRRLIRQRPLKHLFAIFYRSSLVEIKTTFILDLMGTSASILSMIALTLYIVTGDGRFDGLGAMIIGSAL